MSSYSLSYCRKLKIDTISLRNEVRKLTNKNACNMNLLTNYSTIDYLINKIAIWRQSNLRHSNIKKSRIGIYGELLAASLLTKEECFENWLASLAVYGYADNTNKDIKYEWMEGYKYGNVEFNVEIKTLNHYGRTVILEHKNGQSTNFEYPDCLGVVRNTHSDVYQFHSMTTKNTLENIVTTTQLDDSIRYNFNVHRLTLL